ncbi:MAG TPA: sulfur oxidation c-type cytochrome SoxA [Beijerinckiaceae bacterium]|jgi:sulfur-oxidizing protein SoxA
MSLSGFGLRAIGLPALLGLLGAAATTLAGEIPPEERRSGFDLMSRETQAAQTDDTANPGMLWVLQGESLWKQAAGAGGRACADCHQDARNSMRGVAARYPAFSPVQGRPITLEERINLCRANRQEATPLKWESPELVALTTYVGHQSRGQPIAVEADDTNRPFIDKGRQLFEQRMGQLNLSCAACHDDNWGRRLAGNPVPQAHPTGYPLYRLEWQSVGSLQRRLRGCMTGIRAEPYDYGSPENAALELYLMYRARGLKLETPAVRP